MRIFYNLLQVREPAADVARRLRLTFTFPFYNQLQSNYFPFSALFFAWVFPTIPQQSLKTTVKGKPSKKKCFAQKNFTHQTPSNNNQAWTIITTEFTPKWIFFTLGPRRITKGRGGGRAKEKCFPSPHFPRRTQLSWDSSFIFIIIDLRL